MRILDAPSCYERMARAERKSALQGCVHKLEYSCNKYSNLIGQLEVHYFT